MQSKVDVLLGLQWGDEGKGKIVDVLTPQYDIVARFQGGPNAGHTIMINGQSFVLRSIPSGIFQCKGKNIIGNGVVFDPIVFKKELDELVTVYNKARNDGEPNLLYKIILSDKAHIIIPTHRLLDEYIENYKSAASNNKVGTTKKGIGPAYADKSHRIGLTVGDILSDDFKTKYSILKTYHTNQIKMYNDLINKKKGETEDIDMDVYISEKIHEEECEFFKAIRFIKANIAIKSTEDYINNALELGKTVLAEGAQGTLLDIDFGSYPYVTSSHTVSAGACIGLGVAPNKIGEVYGIFKAYCTRVGEGPFPTELDNELGEKMREIGHEYGAVTKRPRRCGWLDLVALKKSCMINGVTQLIMMKADVLNTFDEIRVCTKYNKEPWHEYKVFDGWCCNLKGCKSFDSFPKEFKEYIKFIENYLNLPITIISIGPDREDTIILNKKDKEDNMDNKYKLKEYNYGMPYVKNTTKLPHFSECTKSYNNEMLTKEDLKYSIKKLSQEGLLGCKNLVRPRSEHEKFEANLHEVLDSLFEFLSAKNKNYGNSALEPIGIFSKGGAEDGILRRMDDKLNRIKNSDVLRKNDIVDLMGYLAILCINKKWTKFNELID